MLVLARDSGTAGIASLAKVKATIAHGYILGGDDKISPAEAKKIAAKTGMTYVPPATKKV